MQETILENYREMYEKFDQDRHLIPENNLVEVKYEEFIQTPMEHMEKIYLILGLEGYEAAESSFRDYAATQKDYRANRHILGSDFIEKVNSYWGHIVDRFGYQRLDPGKAPEKSRVEIPRG